MGWSCPVGFGIPGGWNGWFNVATGVGVDSAGNVYVADFFNHRIQKLASDGTLLAVFGSKGANVGEFDRPTDVAVGPQGKVYVVDFGNDRIQVFLENE